MSRMDRWQRSSKGDTQLSARVDNALKEAFRDWCESQGSTMTEEIVAYMAEVTNDPGQGKPAWLPDDELLAEAYRILDRCAASDTRRVNNDLAETILASHLNLPKEAIKSSILRPLERHDPKLIAPKNGVLTIRPRPGAKPPEPKDDEDTEVETVDREAIRKRLDELADGRPGREL